MGTKPLIFISHKHSDLKIADALSTWLTQVSANGLDVFQSSNGLRHTPGMGRTLTDEIKSAAFQASVMFVIYTEPEDDWDWVMYEVGLAHEPTTPLTKIVLVQCGAAAPAVLRDKTRLVVAEEASRLAFTKEFLTSPFIADHPVLAEYSESYVHAQSASLWTLVGPHIPKALQIAPEWSPHPTFRLQLSLAELPGLDQNAGNQDLALRVAALRSVVITDDNAGVRVLKRQSLQEMALDQLLSEFSGLGRDWIESLVDQVTDCLCRRIPDPPRGGLISPVDGRRYLPIVFRVRWRQFENVVRFDVLLAQVDASS